MKRRYAAITLGIILGISSVNVCMAEGIEAVEAAMDESADKKDSTEEEKESFGKAWWPSKAL